jgi:hypothetical protein
LSYDQKIVITDFGLFHWKFQDLANGEDLDLKGEEAATPNQPALEKKTW